MKKKGKMCPACNSRMDWEFNSDRNEILYRCMSAKHTNNDIVKKGEWHNNEWLKLILTAAAPV